MRRTILTLLLLAVAACARTDAGTGLSDERFIAVIVDLRRAAQETRDDPEGFTARRDQILHASGVTEQQLRDYVEAHGRDLDHMANIWDSINARLGAPD